MLTRLYAGLALAAALTCAVPANAQSIRPPSSIELLAGHAGFADEATIEHSVFGGAGRIYVTPRISIGPEITNMRGPGDDRDWFFLGNFIYDFRSPRSGRPPLVSPFVIAGGGFFAHSDRVGTGIYTSGEGTFAAGAGTRVHITDRVYVMGDLRFGWEWHYRVAAGIGLSL
jgi:hypothetical protein